MRKYTVLFFIAILIAYSFSSKANGAPPFSKYQTNTPPVNDTIPADTVFQRVEVEASFPGGGEAWSNFLQTNLKADIPAKRKAPVGLYTVTVQFIVDKGGKVSDIKALTNHGFGMEQEVMRVLKRSPRWMPAVQDGKKVKAYRKQPISFSISDT